ncbi:MAG: hypothetical protein JF614_25775 [Acidobacteria bacterium]|nr:hypothetical protein [Acidobacteriota bacterium]
MPPFSTSPADWFLAADEIGTRGIQVYSSNNQVTAFIEGQAYMAFLFQLLQGTVSGDYVHIVDWEMNLDADLLGKSKPESALGTVLGAASKRDVDIKIILSLHTTSDNDDVHDQRQITDSAYEGGWHDVHCHVLGPAAIDLEKTFRERWNDPSQPSKLCFAPPLIEKAIPSQSTSGTHNVQILRTYPCRLNDKTKKLPFAPNGEFTARLALLKAINMARELIYIEDQYFISYEVAAAIKLSLALHPNLRVIVVVPVEPDSAIAAFFMNTQQSIIINDLVKTAGDRFAIYSLLNPLQAEAPIYVHAKVAIVDDVWAEIGSMNLNRRSMTNDKEFALAVVDSALTPDGQHCQFARDLRHKLWAAHIDMPEALIEDDPKKGFEQWNRSALPYVRAKPHPRPIVIPPVDLLQQLVYDYSYDTVIDPQSLCSGAPHIPP